MKTYFKRFIIFALSAILIIAPSVSYAASGWGITSAVSSGSRTVVTATKGGYKSAVNIAPSARRLALKLGKGANWVSLLHAAIQLAPDIADIDSFKADYSGNRVKYTVPVDTPDDPFLPPEYYYNILGYWSKPYSTSKYHVRTAEAACALVGVVVYPHWSDRVWVFTSEGSTGTCSSGSISLNMERRSNPDYVSTPPATEDRYISIDAASAQVIKNADAGHAASKAATAAAAVEMVVAGDFDADLLAGAVPVSDSRPLVPSVPVSGNGNTSHGDMTGGDVGAAADASREAADAARKSAQAAADAAKNAADAAREATDAAQDLVNAGADAAEIAAANERAAAAERAAADAKSSADRAAAQATERAAAAERAATAAQDAAKTAADVAAKDLADAIAAGDADAIAAADADATAAAKELADANERAKEAEKAAEKAKAEAAKPFELPAFCTWAAPVCDAIKWLKEEPASMAPMPVDTTSPIDDFDTDKSYITFSGSCPPDYTASLSIMGNSVPFAFSYTPICTVMQALKPFIVGAGYLTAAYIIAGHSRGTKD